MSDIPDWPRAHYPVEQLSAIWEDDGTMPANVATLAEAIVGHRIVNAERGDRKVKTRTRILKLSGLVLTLDNGKEVVLSDTYDCCAYTELESFLMSPNMVDHVITGVGTTDKYQTWHIVANWGELLQLNVGWSCGNAFYYAYGFDISVLEVVGDNV